MQSLTSGQQAELILPLQHTQTDSIGPLPSFETNNGLRMVTDACKYGSGWPNMIHRTVVNISVLTVDVEKRQRTNPQSKWTAIHPEQCPCEATPTQQSAMWNDIKWQFKQVVDNHARLGDGWRLLPLQRSFNNSSLPLFVCVSMYSMETTAYKPNSPNLAYK